MSNNAAARLTSVNIGNPMALPHRARKSRAVYSRHLGGLAANLDN